MSEEMSTATTTTETETTPRTTRERVAQILADGDASQATIAREIGISAAALSQWVRGNYNGDGKAIDRKVEVWLAARDRKDQTLGGMPVAPVWVPTRTAAKIHAALGYAQMAGDLACIYGAAGVGKTHALGKYGQENPNVWMVTMTSAHKGVAPALEEVAYSLGLRDVPLNGARLLREIIRKVKGTNGIIVVDEAQHLLPTALEALRAVHDASGIGLVLCGNESVYARLTGGTRTATFAQLFSRIGKKLRITGALRVDIWEIARHFGVENVDCKPLLYEIGLKPGGLRAVVKTLRLAAMFSGAGGRIGPAHIRAAWKDLADDSVGQARDGAEK